MTHPGTYEQRFAEAEKMLRETIAGRIRLDAILGIGAMGVVYRAHHEGLRKDVALKLIHRSLISDAEMVERFDREAAAASRLDHPNCVRVMDYGATDDGRSYLVMEYLDGCELAEIDGRLPPARVIELSRQVLAGLEHAHGHGLIHRDIKPENIFVTEVGGRERVKLLDFGIAKILSGSGSGDLTRAGAVFGTPHYMSPERATASQADARTDLYSFGIVMYKMLTGGVPFPGEDWVEVLRMQCTSPPPPMPAEIPLSLQQFVLRMIAKSPDDRFATASDALRALHQVDAFAPLPPSQPPAGVTAPAQPVYRPNAAPALAPQSPAPVHADASRRHDPGATIRAPAGPLPQSIQPVRRPRPAWLAPVVGGGAAVLLLAVGLAIWKGGADDPSATDVDVGSSQEGVRSAGGEERAATSEKSDDELVILDDDDAPPDRAFEATLASVDALIDAKRFRGARISLEPLLEAYDQEPALYWRMGRVLTKINPRANAAAALENYRLALTLDPGLLGNEEFAAEFWALLDNPRVRVAASKIAIELLGVDGHQRVLAWVNAQKTPLPYEARRAAAQHLREAGQAKLINEPLQVALDLWQAKSTSRPCEAFGTAVAAATDKPDSFLWGTVAQVEVPKQAEGSTPCPGLAEALGRVRVEYAERFGDLDQVVPAAFAKKPKKRRKKSKRRRKR